MKFKIVNGTVIDPTQNLDGKIQDIFVENGFITNPSTAESAKYNIVYDVKGMVVMAGGDRYSFTYCWWKRQQCKAFIPRNSFQLSRK